VQRNDTSIPRTDSHGPTLHITIRSFDAGNHTTRVPVSCISPKIPMQLIVSNLGTQSYVKMRANDPDVIAPPSGQAAFIASKLECHHQGQWQRRHGLLGCVCSIT